MTNNKKHTIHFTKMHALGNDFVIINGIDQPIDLNKLAIAQLADRHMGIGFDQLLTIEPSKRADFFCRIFNADGSEAEQCGNGLRCVARLIHENGLHSQASFRLETKAGIFSIIIEDDDHILITMGTPFIQENLVELPLQNNQGTVQVCALSLGNPHAIVKVESLDTISAHQLGQEISTHPHFPHGANVGFMQILNRNHIRLRTFERGTGETLSCGSNACAAVAAGIANGWLMHQVNVEFRHGCLSIEWAGEGRPMHMIGPASRVYSGEIDIYCFLTSIN